MKKTASFNQVSRCVARTFSIEEANGIAKRFEAQGYETTIAENKRGVLSIYEVWASKKLEGFEIKPSGMMGLRFIGTD